MTPEIHGADYNSLGAAPHLPDISLLIALK
jgi:hypothetical protein